MKLYIKVEGGNFIGHPVLEENLLQTFPEGIPFDYELFERKPFPVKVGDYEKAVCKYVKQNDVWVDEWTIVPLTDEEKNIKIQYLLERTTEHVSFLKAQAKQMILTCTIDSDLNGVNIWEAYLNLLNNWVFESAVPLTPALPTRPFKNLENQWQM
jgi:hypothetical protein